jgi:hypothetical protein
VASGAVVRFVRFRCLYRRYTAVGFALIACSVVAWLMQIYGCWMSGCPLHGLRYRLYLVDIRALRLIWSIAWVCAYKDLFLDL